MDGGRTVGEPPSPSAFLQTPARTDESACMHAHPLRRENPAALRAWGALTPTTPIYATRQGPRDERQPAPAGRRRHVVGGGQDCQAAVPTRTVPTLPPRTERTPPCEALIADRTATRAAAVRARVSAAPGLSRPGWDKGSDPNPKSHKAAASQQHPPLRLNALSMLECLPDRPASVSSAATAAASVRFADVEPRDISPSGQIRRGTASVPGRRAVPPASGRPGDSSRARACVRRVRAESSDGHARAAGGSSEQGRAKCQVPAAARHDSSSKGPDAHGMIGTSLCTLAVYSLSNSKKGTHHTSCASCMSSVDGIPCHGARFVKLPVQLIWHCIGTRTPRKASPIHHPCMHG
jgi:hypothetical protein